MNCRRYKRWIEDEASGTIAPGVARRLNAHVETCVPCRTYRERTVSVAHLLARARTRVPLIDVRERVLAALRSGEQPALTRAWSQGALWSATAASLLFLLLLATATGLSAWMLLSGPMPDGPAMWRLLKGVGATLWSLVGAGESLVASLLDAAARTAASSSPLLPFFELAGAGVLGLALCSALLHLARELLGGSRPLRNEGR